jgi:hypothetical protein
MRRPSKKSAVTKMSRAVPAPRFHYLSGGLAIAILADGFENISPTNGD